MKRLKSGKTARFKRAAKERVSARLSGRERMSLALYLGHRGLAFARHMQEKS